MLPDGTELEDGLPDDFVRLRAARYLNEPFSSPILDCPYFVNLAQACMQAKQELIAHLVGRGADPEALDLGDW